VPAQLVVMATTTVKSSNQWAEIINSKLYRGDGNIIRGIGGAAATAVSVQLAIRDCYSKLR